MKKKRFWVGHESIFGFTFWIFCGFCLGFIIAFLTGNFK